MMRTFCLALLIAAVTALPSLAVPVPTEPLRGTVYLANGKPAAGAIVWAAKRMDGPYRSVEAAADANGHYSLRLSPGEWFVRARYGSQGGEIPQPYARLEISANQSPPAVCRVGVVRCYQRCIRFSLCRRRINRSCGNDFTGRSRIAWRAARWPTGGNS